MISQSLLLPSQPSFSSFYNSFYGSFVNQALLPSHSSIFSAPNNELWKYYWCALLTLLVAPLEIFAVISCILCFYLLTKTKTETHIFIFYVFLENVQSKSKVGQASMAGAGLRIMERNDLDETHYLQFKCLHLRTQRECTESPNAFVPQGGTPVVGWSRCVAWKKGLAMSEKPRNFMLL